MISYTRHTYISLSIDKSVTSEYIWCKMKKAKMITLLEEFQNTEILVINQCHGLLR